MPEPDDGPAHAEPAGISEVPLPVMPEDGAGAVAAALCPTVRRSSAVAEIKVNASSRLNWWSQFQTRIRLIPVKLELNRDVIKYNVVIFYVTSAGVAICSGAVRPRTPAADFFTGGTQPVGMDFDPHRIDAIDVHIGRRIRLRRRLLGLNQSELARRIGVTFQQVHKYETGQSGVTAARLFAIAEALGVSFEYFYADMPD